MIHAGPMSVVRTEELRTALEDGLACREDLPSAVVGLTRWASRYATSTTIENVEATLGDGTRLHLILKDMSPSAILPGARRAKPKFLYNPRRELETYRSLLNGERIGTPACYAAVADDNAERFWVLLEKFPGVELYQVGDLERWQQAAAWLGLMHSRFAGDADVIQRRGVPLVIQDSSFYSQWIFRAAKFACEAPWAHRSASQTFIDHLASTYHVVIEQLLALPRTIVHGDFNASNILVQRPDSRERVCPVDWELTGLGPGLMDLAALTSGLWADDDRKVIAESYRAALSPAALLPGDLSVFLHALDYCRLQLCVQWLGWSPNWQPSGKHAHDWFGEAVRLADRLGL